MPLDYIQSFSSSQLVTSQLPGDNLPASGRDFSSPAVLLYVLILNKVPRMQRPFDFAVCYRAFPPHHPLIPVDYQLTGQPVLIGGTMGTNSYILTGTQRGMQETFGSTCHGAGRARSRNNSRNKLSYQEVRGV